MQTVKSLTHASNAEALAQHWEAYESASNQLDDANRQLAECCPLTCAPSEVRALSDAATVARQSVVTSLGQLAEVLGETRIVEPEFPSPKYDDVSVTRLHTALDKLNRGASVASIVPQLGSAQVGEVVIGLANEDGSTNFKRLNALQSELRESRQISLDSAKALDEVHDQRRAMRTLRGEVSAAIETETKALKDALGLPA